MLTSLINTEFLTLTKTFLFFLGGFLLLTISSTRVAGWLNRFHLPQVTGLILTGLAIGPHGFQLLKGEALLPLSFVNDIALAFIAFSAGGEFFIKELGDRLKSICIMTATVMVGGILLAGSGLFFLLDFIPLFGVLDFPLKLTLATLLATMMVSMSPSTTIPQIKELRAKGPFTQLCLGVIVASDILVLIFWSLGLSLGMLLISGEPFSYGTLVFILGEIFISIFLGGVLGVVFSRIFNFSISSFTKMSMVVFLGYAIFALSFFVRKWTPDLLGYSIHFEPLLVCIFGSFYLTNFSSHRGEWEKLLHSWSPFFFTTFFTLTGAGLQLEVIQNVWFYGLVLFLFRGIILAGSSMVGNKLAGEPPEHFKISWMPMMSQAGVSLGLLATLGGTPWPWVENFSALVISMIIFNQIFGPPLLSKALNLVHETHIRGEFLEEDEEKKQVIIFGLESQSISLARNLLEHQWNCVIATLEVPVTRTDFGDIQVIQLNDWSMESIQILNPKGKQAIVAMLSDEENLLISTLFYENFGTKDMVVRLNHHENREKFIEIGCLVVQPSTAIVSLLDHMVRSPVSTNLILGQEKNQDTISVIVRDPNLSGKHIRDLHLPIDILILSVKRRGQQIGSHGYTILKLGDEVTLVGSEKSLDEISLFFRKGRDKGRKN